MISRRVFGVLLLFIVTFSLVCMPLAFCTEIINDGFESNDFSAWDGTHGSPATESNNPHCGNYNMIVDAASEDCYETDTEAYSQINARVYIKVASLVDNGDGVAFIDCYVGSPVYGSIAGAMMRNDGGTYEWGIWVHGTGRVWSGETFSVDTWYCAELEYIKGNGDAEIRLDINAVEVIARDTLTIDYSVSNVRVGAGYATGAPLYYIDCCVVADADIGLEGGVDNAPYYSSAGDDGVTGVGEDVSVYCFWEDDLALDTCYLEHNSTGTFSNSSLSVSGTSSWANTTITLNTTASLVVSYRWFCSDNASQWNQTGYYNITLTDAYPTYSNAGDNGVTQVGLIVSVNCLWSDNVGLSVCYLEHNSTGTATNTSLAIAGTSSWANSTFQLNFTANTVVSYRWFCNDTNNQWNITGYYNITTKSLYVTWNHNNSTMGSLFVDGAETANGTQSGYNFNQSISLVGAVASSSYIFESFNWTGGSTETNPYNYLTDGNNTVWCMFDEAGTGTGSTTTIAQGRGIYFVAFAICLAIISIAVLGKKKDQK